MNSTCRDNFVGQNQKRTIAPWLQGPDDKLEKNMEYQDYSTSKIMHKHLYNACLLKKHLFYSWQVKREGGSLRTVVNEEQAEPKPHIREDMRKDEAVQEKSRSRSTSVWWLREKLVRSRKEVRKAWIFVETGEVEQKSTGMVKLQDWKLVLPAEHCWTPVINAVHPNGTAQWGWFVGG